jgi:predicted nucleic acid-binding protein
VTLPPLDPTAPRIFLDSSVLISGIMSQRGASYALLLLAELGLIRVIVCPYIRKETERNLALKVPEILPLYHQLTARINWEIEQDPPSDDVLPLISIIPAKDAPVLAAAINSKPDRLVTLDTGHFIRAMSVSQQSGLLICTPGDLIREIRSLLARGFGHS